MTKNVDRRDFIKSGALLGAGLTLAPGLIFGKKKKRRKKKDDKVKIAFIGVGRRGRTHLRNILLRKDCQVTAMCDIDPDAIARSQKLIQKHSKDKVAVYSENEMSYEKMLERDDIDGVIISTPWLWHTRMAVASMKAGKFTGVEVSAANTLEECWDLVNTYEETGTPCMILENVCYRRDVMAVLNMARKNVFGELMHARCGYQHDLRHVKFEPGVEFGEKGRGEARWRTEHSIKRNGDVYPTHGVGPIANMMDINRGNRFVSLTSTATKARGLNDYIINHPEGGKNHKNAGIDWKLGDIVTTVVKTAREESIIITHDTNLPRPYSLGFRVQGVKGLMEFDYYNQRCHIEGVSKPHKWDEGKEWLKKYDHPLWKKFEKEAQGSGHGGMDFFLANAFVETIKKKTEPVMDVYDAAAWSVITPLSEMSIANNSEPQDFPDFTRGRWIKRKPNFGFSSEF